MRFVYQYQYLIWAIWVRIGLPSGVLLLFVIA